VSEELHRPLVVDLILTSITIAPTLGPILGGNLTYTAGWSWIFWFLSLAAGLCLLMMIFLLPETARNIVGNGSIRPSKYLQLPIPTLAFCHWKDSSSSNGSNSLATRKWRMPNPFKSLMILVRKDNTIIITACGLLYVVYTCVNTSLSTLFVDMYGFNQWQTSLIYIPFGAGGIVSTLFSGPLLDHAYRKARTEQGLSTDRAAGDDLDSFPVEKARIRVLWIPLLVTTFSVLTFGWVLHYRRVRGIFLFHHILKSSITN
jgi:MFS family permease